MNPETNQQTNLAESLNVTDANIHPVNQVTPVSKYLTLALFIILPFLGGYVGYKLASEKVVEVEKVPQTIDQQTDITKAEFDSILSEVAGGIRNIDLFSDASNGWMVNQLMDERYTGTIDDNILDDFILKLDELVENEDFKTISTFIPEQGFFYAVASGQPSFPNRSRVAGSQIWSKDQVANLLTIDRFHKLTETVKSERPVSLVKNPARLFGIKHDSYPLVDNSIRKPTADDFSCAPVTDPVVIEDIMALGVQNPIAMGDPIKREVSFADNFYKCSSSWGGTAVDIYIQPSRTEGTPEIIGATAAFWE